MSITIFLQTFTAKIKIKYIFAENLAHIIIFAGNFIHITTWMILDISFNKRFQKFLWSFFFKYHYFQTTIFVIGYCCRSWENKLRILFFGNSGIRKSESVMVTKCIKPDTTLCNVYLKLQKTITYVKQKHIIYEKLASQLHISKKYRVTVTKKYI